jgi:choice-of-anchor C domain-containing protein
LAAFAAVSARSATIFTETFNPYTGTPASFTTLSNGGTLTADNTWSVGGAGVDWIGNYWPGVDGSNDASVDLSALNAGSLSTALSTVAGQAYTLTFYIAGNPDGGSTTKHLQVQVGDLNQTVVFDNTGYSLSHMGWTLESFSFIAQSNSDTLTFTSLENNPYGPALDAISVSDSSFSQTDAVPEPGTCAAMTLGLGGLAFFHRRRRAR